MTTNPEMHRFGSRIERLLENARAFYDNGDPSHDFSHVRRVMSTCGTLAPTIGANLDIVLAAAVLHDIVNLPKNHPERAQASARAAEQSQAYLEEAGFTPEEIARIRSVITEHSFSRGMKPSSPESAVLQDADRLDSLGAIGILRTATCGARMGSSYYDAAEPFARTRGLDDKAFTIDHFYVKLLKLPELMNTDAGRREANRRAGFMLQFLETLRSEIGADEAFLELFPDHDPSHDERGQIGLNPPIPFPFSE